MTSRALRSLLLLLLLGPVAGAEEPSLSTPAPADLAQVAAELERRVVEAEARGQETASLQNAWVTSGAPGRKPCQEPADLVLAQQAEAAGKALRDASQAARAQADRVRELLLAPSLAPLLDEAALARHAALIARADESARRTLEASAWHARFLAPVLARCSR